MSGKHKKGHEEEHENHERWLVSYADFITLLFAFFVVMYAVSEVDARKLKKFSDSVQFAFDFAGTGRTYQRGLSDGSAPHDPRPAGGGVVGGFQQMVSPDEFEERMRIIERALAEEIHPETGTPLRLRRDRYGFVLSFPASYLFAPAEAEVRADRQRSLKLLTEALKEMPFPVRLEGRTVNVPLRGGAGATTWNQLLARLETLRVALHTQSNVPDHRLSVSARSDELDPGSDQPASHWDQAGLIEIVVRRMEG